MAFLLIGPEAQVVIADEDQCLFFDLPRTFGLKTPQCDFIWGEFYSDPQLTSPEQVGQLRSEIEAIRAAYEMRRKKDLVREKRIHSKDPAVVANALGRLLEGDPVLVKCDEIVRLCDAAIAVGKGLSCSSD